MPKPCVRCGTCDKAPGKQRCFECLVNEQSPLEREIDALRRLECVPEEARVPRVPAALWPAGRRWCSACQSFRRLVDCSGSRCTVCVGVQAHEAKVIREYGLLSGQYAQMLHDQKYRCAICRNRPKTERLAVDHNHKTGRPRGLLCSRCNHDLLGAAHDSLNILRSAVAYLESPPYDRISPPDDGPEANSPTLAVGLGTG